jgi:hypothetical protein
MRIVLLLSTLVFAACTVGEVGTANNTGTDAGSGSGSGSGSDFAACANRLTPPGPAHMHTAGGTSNKGQNCLQSGCHLNTALGTGAPGYQFAGTVYAAGTTNPQAGAVIRIKSGTMVLTTYTDTDGNFSFPAGSLQGTFTATTNVSACPSITSMATQMMGGSGGGAGANSCNLCHNTAGTGVQAPPISL